MSLTPTLRAAALTHPGMQRTKNEDYSCVRIDLGLFVVADGMGGHAAGEVASRLAVHTIQAFVQDTRAVDGSRAWPFDYDQALSLQGNRLNAAVRLANRRLADAIDADESLCGMGTTVVALLMPAGSPTVAHVGDSRCYVCRDGDLRQVTQDHSWVGDQVRAGLITETNARRHPWRNVVTRAVAGGEDPPVDIAEIAVLPGDRLLLCSDGLSGVITSEQMAAIVGPHASLEQTCAQLIDAANAAGGPDNITVVMVEIPPSKPMSRNEGPRP